MDGRKFVQSAVGTGALALLALRGARAGAADSAGRADAQLRSLLEIFLDEEIEARPRWATQWGLDVGRHAAVRSRLGDCSSSARGEGARARSARLARLRELDARRLSAAARLQYELLAWQYAHQAAGAARFAFGGGPQHNDYGPFAPYVFSQLGGPCQEIPDLLSLAHPLREAADAEAWIARLEAFTTALADTTVMLREDAAGGVLAPDFALDTAIAQLSKLRAAVPSQSDLAMEFGRHTAQAGLAGEWRSRAGDVLRVLRAHVYPALQRLQASAEVLRPKAVHEAGAWRLPDGEAFYAQAIAWHTTTNDTPGEVHRIGLERIRECSSRLEPLLRAQGLTEGSVAQRLDALGRRPDQLWAEGDAGRPDLLEWLTARDVAIRSRLPRAFRTLPAAPLEIVRVPPEIEDGAPLAYARSAPLDGSRPGRFYINLKDTREWPRFMLPTVVYHEGIPGHQWQNAIARESQDIPALLRTGATFAAYSEGWALYAEELAAELGAYDDVPSGGSACCSRCCSAPCASSSTRAYMRCAGAASARSTTWWRSRRSRAPGSRARSTAPASGPDRPAATRLATRNGGGCGRPRNGARALPSTCASFTRSCVAAQCRWCCSSGRAGCARAG